MIKDILKQWDIDIKKSIMIGDNKTDFLAAKKSKINFYYNNKKNISRIKTYYKKLNLI